MRHHNEIVVGHSLAAVTYAYLNDATLILNCQDSKPFLFDFFEPEFDLSMFALHPVIYEMQAQESKRTVGFPKIDLWHRALFAISISGNLPLSNKLSSLRINEQEKVITLITLDGTRIEYGYNTLRIFNVDKIQGGFSPSLPEKYRVVDWFDVRSGCCHMYDYLSGETDLAKEIYFYPSNRPGTKKGSVKDLVSVSYLTKEQLSDIEYSDIAVRFKVLDVMRRSGIRGARNGRDQKNPKRYKYYAVRIEADRREVQIPSTPLCADLDNIYFDSRTEEEVILKHSNQENHIYKTLSQLVRE